jgi:hypothetical protein
MSIARHHAEWLSLMEISGPFLSIPVLLRVFPQGLEYANQADHVRTLRLAYEEWEDNQEGLRPDPAIHQAWVRFVLEQTLDLTRDLLAQDQALSPHLQATIAEHNETLRPDLAVITPSGRSDAGKPRLLVQIYPKKQDLEKPLAGERWKASPATRMMELLRATEARLGLVTNGEQWMLVSAIREKTTNTPLPTGFASWYASVWLEERITLHSFRSLLSRYRFFGVQDSNTLEEMLAESATNQAEVTNQLGDQVRHAVEMLIQTVDRIDKELGRILLAGVEEQDLYNAALTVMMRLVFLFCAEERGLLLLGDALYDAHYAVSTLRAQLREAADQHSEEVLQYRYDAWSRLLATFRAVHGGVEHDAMRLPAYGGHLFDPDRYPFLEGRTPGTKWRETPAAPLRVDNRTVLHLLEALQMLELKTASGGFMEKQRLSFRALDIEQIGHVYEGLLDHTARRASGPVLGLAGARDSVPEVPLEELEEAAKKGEAALLELLEERTRYKGPGLKRKLEAASTQEEMQRLRTACDNDEALYKRVLPFVGLLREDSFGHLVVIAVGSVYVTAGEDRRSSGTHYTPRSLTEPMVQYTLEPLVYVGPAEGLERKDWRLRPPAELLQLKVCDMAMGSGAFLVQAGRYLADRLMEGWAEIEAVYREEGHTEPQITPEGMLSRGVPNELLVPKDPGERRTEAMRLICDRCLYGVDKNPMAVEMAKLSLWLATLAKGRPFTFLDHALRWGDSLLGADVAQLSAWSLDREEHGNQQTWFEPVIRQALDRALKLRRQIASTPVVTVRDAEDKEHLLAEAEEAMALVKLGGDLLVGSALAPTPKERKATSERLLIRYFGVVSALEEYRRVPTKEQGKREAYEEISKLQEEAQRHLGGRRPFHWPLEFPEVFEALRLKGEQPPFEIDLASLRPYEPGFAAIIGNPPFMGGQKITGALGDEYREYLVEVLANGQRGSADLCAYFFLRAGNLLRRDGNFGLLATNTIAQGNTREVGLDQLAGQGFKIYRAVPSRPWPGSASLEVAYAWLRRGYWNGQCVLGDRPVPGITPFLTEASVVNLSAVVTERETVEASLTIEGGTPYRLAANANKSFQGSIVLGMGFVLTPEEAQALIIKNPRNKDVLFPYLNGEDLNSRPDQSGSRWVINLFDWSLERAETYPDCMAIVREKVKPEREKQNDAGAQKLWWRFLRPRPELFTAVEAIERVLVVGQTSKHHAFAFKSKGIVYDQKLVVFAIQDYGSFALLTSRIHLDWALRYGSTLETRPVYTPTDCFETFPFPEGTDNLEGIGERYYLHRQEIMLRRQEGLTKTYNRFHDPNERAEDIATLRALHVDMDQAVAVAYGWGDLDLGHSFHETKQGLRYTISEAARQEVLGRLLTLNHQRYAEEVAQGLHNKGSKNAKKGTSGKGRDISTPITAKVGPPGLFDEEE